MFNICKRGVSIISMRQFIRWPTFGRLNASPRNGGLPCVPVKVCLVQYVQGHLLGFYAYSLDVLIACYPSLCTHG